MQILLPVPEKLRQVAFAWYGLDQVFLKLIVVQQLHYQHTLNKKRSTDMDLFIIFKPQHLKDTYMNAGQIYKNYPPPPTFLEIFFVNISTAIDGRC